MTKALLPIVALSSGDPAGIGPELCLKAAVSSDVLSICQPIIYSDLQVLRCHVDACGIDVELEGCKTETEIDWSSSKVKFIELNLFGNSKFLMGKINKDNGKASIECVAAPQTEKSIHLAGIEFDCYPSFVARQTGLLADDVYLMVCFDNYRIAHCTLHSSVRQSLELIT